MPLLIMHDFIGHRVPTDLFSTKEAHIEGRGCSIGSFICSDNNHLTSPSYEK